MSDRVDEVPDDLVVDLLWSNPPIRIGKEALHELLRDWLARLETEIGRQRFAGAMSDGFADVNAELVTVLVSRCDLAADIDTAETQSELAAAEAGLRELGSAEEDAHARSEFESAIGAARLRLDVAGRS